MDLIQSQASAEDIESIMNIEENSFIAEIQEDKAVFLERIKCNPELFLLYSEQHKIFSYISAEYLETIPETAEELKLGHSPKNSSEIKNKTLIYISSFAILPEYRGKGMGKLLWQKSIEYYCSLQPKPEKLLLLVNSQWKGAEHIYQESGFKRIKVFKNFFCTETKGFSDGYLYELVVNG